MISSVNTNTSSYSSINSFGSAQSAVHSAQKRIGTGKKVADAYDNGAAFAVAEKLRGDTAVLGAANERLAVGKGMIDVAMKASQFISSSMSDVKATLVKLSDTSLSERDRANYQAQYNSQVKDIGAFVKDAKYNGVNLLEQGAQNQNIASNGSGGSVTVQAQDLDILVASLLSGADVSTAAGAAALLQPGGTFAQAEDSVGSAMNNLAANSRSINNSIKGNSSIMDATDVGLREIVDADLAKEAASLSAAQAKQQLAGQVPVDRQPSAAVAAEPVPVGVDLPAGERGYRSGRGMNSSPSGHCGEAPLPVVLARLDALLELATKFQKMRRAPSICAPPSRMSRAATAASREIQMRAGPEDEQAPSLESLAGDVDLARRPHRRLALVVVWSSGRRRPAQHRLGVEASVKRTSTGER